MIRIGIIFSLTSLYVLSLGLCLFFGFYDNIWDSFHILFLWWFLFIIDYVIRIILCIMIIFFLFYVFVWGYGYIILVIINFLDYCYLYHRAGIYFILWCDILFYLCSFGTLLYVIILSLFYDHCFEMGVYIYPWSMMSSDLNCVCWWEM